MSSISNQATRTALAAALALGTTALVQGCCFGGTTGQVTPPVASGTPVPVVVAPVGGGSGLCGRATECCTAYVDAIQNAQGNVAAQAMAGSIEQVRSVCGTYAGMPASPGTDQGCQSAIDGYRSGLTAIGLTVPTACQ